MQRYKKKNMTANKKTIKLRMGCIKKLSEDIKVSTLTIRKALRYDNDTDKQRMVRNEARKRGYIKEF